MRPPRKYPSPRNQNEGETKMKVGERGEELKRRKRAGPPDFHTQNCLKKVDPWREFMCSEAHINHINNRYWKKNRTKKFHSL